MFHNNKLALILSALACLAADCTVKHAHAESAVVRRAEFQRLMRTVSKPSDGSMYGGPGWLQPSNHIALRAFIAHNAETEEAFQAEIWLIFGESWLEPRQGRETAMTRGNSAERLASLTKNAGTKKAAEFLSAWEFSAAEEWQKAEAVMRRIIANSGEYKKERDANFQSFLRAADLRQDDVEPFVRHMVVIDLCLRRELDRALDEAKALYRSFPKWSKQNNIDNIIAQIATGKSPYSRL